MLEVTYRVLKGDFWGVIFTDLVAKHLGMIYFYC